MVAAGSGGQERSDRGNDAGPNYALRLGIQKDQVVQELGWDEDTDDDIRADIEDACGGELLDEDADEVIDVVLLWWRDGDGDLVDRLMDAITPLADDGVIWVVTPKTGKSGHVMPKFEGVLPDQTIDQIVQWLLTLK